MRTFSTRSHQNRSHCIWMRPNGLSGGRPVLSSYWVRGVWALQGYTKLANLVEVNAVRSGVEVETRNNGYEEIRWATNGRLNRIRSIKQWNARANTGYTWMTYLFMSGLGLLLIYAGVYAFQSRSDSPVQFTAVSSHDSDVLGVVQDKVSATSCVVMRSNSRIRCAAPEIQ